MTTAPSLHREVAKPDQQPRNALLHEKHQPTQELRAKHTHTHTQSYGITVTPGLGPARTELIFAVARRGHSQSPEVLLGHLTSLLAGGRDSLPGRRDLFQSG